MVVVIACGSLCWSAQSPHVLIGGGGECCEQHPRVEEGHAPWKVLVPQLRQLWLPVEAAWGGLGLAHQLSNNKRRRGTKEGEKKG